MRLLCLLPILLLPSCAAIFMGSTKSVTLKTDPPGAKATVDGSITKLTPCSFKLARDTEHQVFVEMDGYKTYTVNIRSVESGMILGNLLFGGIIGIAVDGASGASKTLKPDRIALMLELGEGNVVWADENEDEDEEEEADAEEKEEAATVKPPKPVEQ